MRERLSERLRQQALFYVLNELPPEAKDSFEMSLQENVSLKEYVSALRQTLSETGELPFRKPSESFLKSQRNLLRGRIAAVSDGPSPRKFGRELATVPSRLAQLILAPRRPALAAITYTVIGLLIGRFFLTGPFDAGALSRSSLAESTRILEAMELGSLTAEQVQFVENGTDKLLFHLKDDEAFTYAASPDDEFTRDLLGYITLNEPNPGKRLKSIKLASSLSADEKVKMILVSVLLEEENAGIRLRAIKSLSDYPDDPTIWKAAMKVLLEDENTAIRIEALSILARNPRETLIPVLQVVSRLDENPYIKDQAGIILSDLLETSQSDDLEELFK